jgi:hypothetical protein
MKNTIEETIMKKLMIACLTVCGVLSAQTPAQERKENANREAAGLTHLSRHGDGATAKAISYQHRSNEDRLQRYGAHAERTRSSQGGSKQGYIEIEWNSNLPTQFGVHVRVVGHHSEGRTSNLGEIA